MGYGVDFYLYASVLDVKRCADCCDGTVTRFSTCGARLRGYSCFRLPHFGSVLNCQYRSIQAQVSFFQHSTIATLYKKGPGVCRGARPCAPLRFSHISMWISPLRGAAAYAAYTAGIPQSMRAFGRGLRSPCGYYFPIQNLENISLTRSSPSDSPRIRPRLSYASVRSME